MTEMELIMKKSVYVLLICCAWFMFALTIGGCGSDVEPEVQIAAEIAEPELSDSAIEEQSLEVQAQDVVGQLRRELREVALRVTPDTPVVEASELPTYEPLRQQVGSYPAPPVDPTGVWGDALEEYLAQFLSLFHNAEDRDSPGDWARWGDADWWDFVEVLPDDPDLPRIFWAEYETNFVFRNPITAERLEGFDIPYLARHSVSMREYDGTIRSWTISLIATHFELFFLDDTDIPTLLIHWNTPIWLVPEWQITLHRFRDGSFEHVENLSLQANVSFHRAEDSRLFIEYHSVVARMIDLRLLYLYDEITTTPVLSTNGDRHEAIRNHLTGEEFLIFYPDGGFIQREYWASERFGEARLEYYLGVPITRIEPLYTMHEQLMERVSQRLRDEGLVG